MPNTTAWWRPHFHADRRPLLLTRGRVKEALRRLFVDEGFTEVESGILQVSPGNETHLHAFASALLGADGVPRPLYLHTSPEFACKKLLAAGETRIFDFARVFRNRERSDLHHPEFTMLEWYRAETDYRAMMADCARLLPRAAEAAGATRLAFRGREADPFAKPEELTVVEAFARHADIDLAPTLGPDGADNDRDRLAALAGERGIRTATDDTWSDIFSRILSERIEPGLGCGRPTLLTDYPASEAALARRKPDDPRLAERFELYACGVELANAFSELTDPHEQRRRFEADMAEKERIYGESYPIDEEFLAALALMPAASGCALGFDRLVMLLAGARRIEDVIWTPMPREEESRP
ncbi:MULTISPECIES: EF-P lysine aminoacylase EpmA [Chelatococcus]|uniref:Lysyl-tRNA synthetase class 2 n=1 Tax=Chelatococcus caeni TaxID=1348468 RepID=A0A840BZZ5_9HYPH|nr:MULTISPECIES: EF-P lysine aminoacylase EpmA [Chelatococcus]ALA16990.1 lysyl-tRNA synthetase [Chelatococcus sp. CO-6]MBB4017292.1 lysyl-tRNA synthetase class 2 [Chelatococcus caeni]